MLIVLLQLLGKKVLTEIWAFRELAAGGWNVGWEKLSERKEFHFLPPFLSKLHGLPVSAVEPILCPLLDYSCHYDKLHDSCKLEDVLMDCYSDPEVAGEELGKLVDRLLRPETMQAIIGRIFAEVPVVNLQRHLPKLLEFLTRLWDCGTLAWWLDQKCLAVISRALANEPDEILARQPPWAFLAIAFHPPPLPRFPPGPYEPDYCLRLAQSVLYRVSVPALIPACKMLVERLVMEEETLGEEGKAKEQPSYVHALFALRPEVLLPFSTAILELMFSHRQCGRLRRFTEWVSQSEEFQARTIKYLPQKLEEPAPDGYAFRFTDLPDWLIYPNWDGIMKSLDSPYSKIREAVLGLLLERRPFKGGRYMAEFVHMLRVEEEWPLFVFTSRCLMSLSKEEQSLAASLIMESADHIFFQRSILLLSRVDTEVLQSNATLLSQKFKAYKDYLSSMQLEDNASTVWVQHLLDYHNVLLIIEVLGDRVSEEERTLWSECALKRLQSGVNVYGCIKSMFHAGA